MSRRDLLSAIPVAAADTQLELWPGRGGVLTRRAPERASRLQAWLAQRLRFHGERRFELDEMGAYFWEQVDGKRPLSDIHAALCRRYGLSPEPARRSVVEFTAAMLRRDLLALRLEKT